MATIRYKTGHLALRRGKWSVLGYNRSPAEGFSIQVEGVVPEPIDVLCEIGADGREGVCRNGFAALL
jgi:hypothetical protein